MDKINTIKAPKKGEVHHYFIASDFHTDKMHQPSYEIMLRHAQLLPPDNRRLIINGDFLDCEHLMQRGENFKTWSKRTDGIDDFFIPMSESEFAWGNARLDELEKVFTEIVFINGNHDWRYDWFMASKHCPDAYAINFDLRKQLKLKERNIRFIQYNDWLDIGKLSITHGQFHGATAHRKHLDACGRSCIFGHIHKFEARSFAFRGETKTAWSLPAMSDLNPCYMKNKDSAWSNGYATFHVKSNGNFNLHVHNVWDNELILPDGRIGRF